MIDWAAMTTELNTHPNIHADMKHTHIYVVVSSWLTSLLWAGHPD